MLLDEIIDILSDSKGSLTDALLKTKVLLHTIGKKDLATWVTHELTGYPEPTALPSYRIASSEVRGHVVSFRWQQTDAALPIQHLKPEQIKQLTTAPIMNSIESIEEAVRSYRAKGGGLRLNLSPEFSTLFNEALAAGVQVNSAWSQINMLDVENILSEVRSRLLDFALELRDAVGADVSAHELRNKAAEVDAGRMFKAAIYGGTNTLVMGSQGVQSINVSNNAGDLEGLAKALSTLGIAPQELDQLKHAVKDDEASGKVPNVSDGKTGHWYTKTLKEAGKGVLKAGVDVAAATIVKAIQAYSGTMS